MMDDMAPTTVGQRVSAVSTFYQECQKLSDSYEEIGDVPENPYDGFDKQDKKMLRGNSKKQKSLQESDGDKYVYLETDEIKKMINSVPSPQVRNELVIRLMFDCGFRRGELAHAKVEHINSDLTIWIPPRKSKGRTVAYREDTNLLLNRWLNHGGRESMTYAGESDYLFPTNKSKHISANHINQIVKNTAENAGIQDTTSEYSDGRSQHKITSHTLRHSFAMDKLKKVDIEVLQKLMGHKDIETTMVYVNMSDDAAREASKQFTDL
jgi:integrase/recombinase XerD